MNSKHKWDLPLWVPLSLAVLVFAVALGIGLYQILQSSALGTLGALPFTVVFALYVLCLAGPVLGITLALYVLLSLRDLRGTVKQIERNTRPAEALAPRPNLLVSDAGEIPDARLSATVDAKYIPGK